MISILTCSYNREKYLYKLYKSLIKQTLYDFEWIVVDDGSEDHTGKLMDSLINRTNEFHISYYYQQNGGKHKAVNEGMRHVLGEWVFLVDSDDELVSDAIETIQKWVSELRKESDFEKFAAVSGLKALRNGKILGGFPNIKKAKFIDAKNTERKKYRLGGDKAEVYKVQILRKYPFPTFHNEKFLSEDAVWNKIAIDGYKIRWYPKVIYLCDYLGNGLTKDENKYINSFDGFTYVTKISLEAFHGIYKIRPITKYIYYAKMKGYNSSEIISTLNIPCWNYFVGVVMCWAYKIIKKLR